MAASAFTSTNVAGPILQSIESSVPCQQSSVDMVVAWLPDKSHKYSPVNIDTTDRRAVSPPIARRLNVASSTSLDKEATIDLTEVSWSTTDEGEYLVIDLTQTPSEDTNTLSQSSWLSVDGESNDLKQTITKVENVQDGLRNEQ